MKESPEAAEILQDFKKAVALGLKSNALQEMPHLTLLNLDFYEEHLKPVGPLDAAVPEGPAPRRPHVTKRPCAT
jgi:hypothetical protein